MRLARLTLLALLLTAVACGDAAAAGPSQTGVLSITPARRSITGHPPARLTPTVVRNTTPFVMNVTVFTSLLYQDLDGSFNFHEDARELNAARLILGVSPTKFVLKPGEFKKLDLHWDLLPSHARAAYIGLVIQGIPTKKGKGVGSILRLLGINFFKLPGHYKQSGTITQIRGQQAAPRVLRFLPRVKNTGQIHAQPQRGRCVITKAGTGQVEYRASFGAGVILPGAEREYPILVKQLIPAGDHRISCSMRFGSVSSTRALDFRLSDVNTLPTANVKLVSVKASGDIGGAANVAVALRNGGSKASPALLKVQLQRLPVGKPPLTVARTRADQGIVAAGASKHVTIHLGKLVKSGYRAVVVLSDRMSDVDQLTADFTPTKHKGIWDWVKDHILWIVLILVALLIAFVLWRQRKRRRELEQELERARLGQAAQAPPPPQREPVAAAPPPSPQPPPPPPPATGGDGRININTASVEQLMQLPGLGRRAAERIVAHREANGPFRSLDDLHSVEGFHEERIRRIADDADV